MKLEQLIENKELLPPLWIAYPEIERGSIGWRMGYGESYICEWGPWYNSLSDDEQISYKELFPEPITWKGYWKQYLSDDENEYEDGEYFNKKEFYIQFWQENGISKYSRELLQNDYLKGINKQKYTMFWGHQPSKDGSITKSCFSQWWMSEFLYVVDRYCCMEQFMMSMKAKLFDDKEMKAKIMASRDPKQIKAFGRKVKNFDETIWNKVKYSIVLNGNYRKFTQNVELRDFLLSTRDDILVEASPYDAVWGIKMSADDKDAENPMKWKGENLLGFALMEVRDEIRRVWANADLCKLPDKMK